MTRSSAPLKKLICCVRPGILEVRASDFRLVSAFTRLDLPTFERPANAISRPRAGGSELTEPAPERKSQAEANSLRPASISCREKGAFSFIARPRLACRRVFPEHRPDVVEEFDLGAVLLHDDALLDHRERVVPRPVDHETRRKARQHEGKDERHPREDHL